MQKELAIIMLNWNGSQDTIECLDSLSVSKYLCDIYILDNASKPEQLSELESYLNKSDWRFSICSLTGFTDGKTEKTELVLIKSEKNLGFAVGNNRVAEKIGKDYKCLLLLNNDTVVPKNSIKNMLEAMGRYKPTALTCDIRYNYDRSVLWNAGGNFKWYGDRKYFSQKKIDKLEKKNIKYIKAQFVTGCALMVDCNYINGYGLLTEKFFHGEEDYNFCYRLKKKKLRVGVDLTSRIYHKVGQSINRSDDNTKKLKSNIVHYTNRVIDYKEFYGSFRWRLWRIFYINLVILKRRLSGLDKGAAKLLKRKIYFYSNNFDNVKWDVFSEIMNDPDIC
ncbi:MAG: glycosyltransferase family 2 protein [Clostridia bacterium]|nr:glycosyltransferase family 2 protein [Clostridia bacterium]